MGLAKNSLVATDKGRLLGKRRINHCKRLKHLSQKLKITISSLKEMKIRPVLKQHMTSFRQLTRDVNIRSLPFDENLQIKSSVAFCTAAVMGLFTGSIISGVAQAAASTVVSFVVSEAIKKKKSPMDDVTREAKRQTLRAESTRI